MKKTSMVFLAILATVIALVGVNPGKAEAAPKVAIGGGSGILVLKGGNNAAACTVTAIGRSNGRLVGLTAGHCGTPGQWIVKESAQGRGRIGRIVAKSNANLDAAIISFDSSKVRPVRSVRGTTIRRISTNPGGFPDTLCKQGRTTGRTCGVNWLSDGAFHYSQMCVVEGDSGAPVVRGTSLVGMVNAYYFFACVGPETGTNIGPIMRWMSRAGYGGFRLV